MRIRAEQDHDRAAVRRVHTLAFGGDHGVRVAALVDTLRADPATLSLVAVADGTVAGHVMFSRCLLDAPARLVEVSSLSPLAVLPQQQRRGIGRALIRHGLAELDRRGVPLVFLEGDPGYYAGSGFAAGGFRKPSLRIPDAAFQACRLSAYEPWMTGTFVYSAAFWAHDAVGLRDAEPGVPDERGIARVDR
jgi:putative acetyltransferase